MELTQYCALTITLYGIDVYFELRVVGDITIRIIGIILTRPVELAANDYLIVVGERGRHLLSEEPADRNLARCRDFE